MPKDVDVSYTFPKPPTYDKVTLKKKLELMDEQILEKEISDEDKERFGEEYTHVILIHKDGITLSPDDFVALFD